jgi:uncharacterized protein
VNTTKGAAVIERDGYPPGVPCWVDTAQPDPQAAVRFYRGLFGWEFEDRMPADAPGHYYVAQLQGRDVAAVGSQPDGAARPPAWSTYIWVQSADDTAAKVRAAGGSVLTEPFDVLDAGRMAVLADPSGAVFCAWQPNRHRGAQVVNEAGTWNFSNLETADPEPAKAFYGAVFGWEADTLEFMGHSFTMWRVPGYGDFLEELDPGIRRRHAEGGAPAGFTDAVGFVVAPRGDGGASSWHVTFAVDDADAAAARAEELGGRVVVEPYDAPPTRVAVLSDPQGAVFSVSKFDPGQ